MYHFYRSCKSSAGVLTLCTSSLIIISNRITVCDSNETGKDVVALPLPSPSPSACARYNTLIETLNWRSRRKRCNNDPNGCMFLGRSIGGKCVNAFTDADIDRALSKMQEVDEVNDNRSSAKDLITAVDDAVNDENYSIFDALRRVKTNNPDDYNEDHVARLLADKDWVQLLRHKNGRAAVGFKLAHEYAEEILKNPQYIRKFDEFLHFHLLEKNTVDQTKKLVYYWIHQPIAFDLFEYQLRWQIRYWIRDPEPYGAMFYTTDQVMLLCEWWLALPSSRVEVLKHFFTWYAAGGDVLTSNVLAKSIPGMQKVAISNIKNAMIQKLRSDEVKEIARNHLLKVFKKLINKDAEVDLHDQGLPLVSVPSVLTRRLRRQQAMLKDMSSKKEILFPSYNGIDILEVKEDLFRRMNVGKDRSSTDDDSEAGGKATPTDDTGDPPVSSLSDETDTDSVISTEVDTYAATSSSSAEVDSITASSTGEAITSTLTEVDTPNFGFTVDVDAGTGASITSSITTSDSTINAEADDAVVIEADADSATTSSTTDANASISKVADVDGDHVNGVAVGNGKGDSGGDNDSTNFTDRTGPTADTETDDPSVIIISIRDTGSSSATETDSIVSSATETDSSVNAAAEADPTTNEK